MVKPLIYIAADHAAFELKKRIVTYLKSRGYKVRDFGPYRFNPDDDYPDFIVPMARAVARAKPLLNPPLQKGRKKVEAYGIALGGSGIGECIAANKVRGVRAALVYDLYTARMSREHNGANVLCLGARAAPSKKFSNVKKFLDVWLKTPFSNAPRHNRRLKKIKLHDS